jgi:hypothetical protein
MTKVLASRLIAISAALVVTSAALGQSNDLNQATEGLRTTIAEWRHEESAYRAARAAAKISRQESEEYAEFIANLRLRVLEQCESVRSLGGEAAVQPFDCVRTGLGPQAAVVVPPAAALTDEEKRAALNARLDQLEGDIDESLLKRQQEIRQTAGTARGSGTGFGQGAAGAAGGGKAGGGTQGSGGTAGASTGSWTRPDEPAPSGERSTSPGTNSSAGQGLPTSAGGSANRGPPGRQAATDGGIDDDVVARQLREAAEKETDPVLKEKLWAEYRKYNEAKKR